jgi:DNA-directed RNA polymerase specialized sigma24 family protein
MESPCLSLLGAAGRGDSSGAGALIGALYAELHRLAKTDPGLAELVDLKFFCGFSFSEIAAMRGVSERTVQRNWEKARIYLHRSIRSRLSY